MINNEVHEVMFRSAVRADRQLDELYNDLYAVARAEGHVEFFTKAHLGKVIAQKPNMELLYRQQFEGVLWAIDEANLTQKLLMPGSVFAAIGAAAFFFPKTTLVLAAMVVLDKAARGHPYEG